jgi:hypothetical protein
MRKTSLIPVLNSISNAEITALTNGEKLLKFTNIFDDETLRLFHQARYILEPSIVPGQEHRARVGFDLNKGLELDGFVFDAEDYEVIKRTISLKLGIDYNYIGVTLWEDTEGYSIPKHVDNSSFNAAMQIYLPTFDEDMNIASYNALPNTGTIFYDGIQEYQIPFIPNTGYFCTNSQSITHSSGDPVKAGHVRRSLYIYFKHD